MPDAGTQGGGPEVSIGEAEVDPFRRALGWPRPPYSRPLQDPSAGSIDFVEVCRWLPGFSPHSAIVLPLVLMIHFGVDFKLFASKNDDLGEVQSGHNTQHRRNIFRSNPKMRNSWGIKLVNQKPHKNSPEV